MLHSLHEWEEKCVSVVERHAPSLGMQVRKYQRLLRYLISGGTAAAVDLLLLYVFTDLLSIHYLISATLAFLIAFWVSFLLQKFWTFQDHSVEGVHKQATLYFVVSALNLLLNTLLMYLFVDIEKINYIVAQILASGLIACESFFISRYVIFKKSNER